MGNSQRPKKSPRVMDPGGCFVIFRRGDGWSWDGLKWVDDVQKAKWYPVAPANGYEESRKERDRLRAAGERCYVLHVC